MREFPQDLNAYDVLKMELNCFKGTRYGFLHGQVNVYRYTQLSEINCYVYYICLSRPSHLTYPLRAHWHIRPRYTASIFACPWLLFLLTPSCSNLALFVLVQWSSSMLF